MNAATLAQMRGNVEDTEMWLTFAKLPDNSIHMGLSEDNTDPFAHGDACRNGDDIEVMLRFENLKLSGELEYGYNHLFSQIKNMLDHGTSRIEFPVSKA